jgi:PAS domain S-box-containing protein
MIRVLTENNGVVAVLRDALLAHGYDVEEELGTDVVLKVVQHSSAQLLSFPPSTAEENYRKLFDYAPDGILIADSNSYYLDANPALCKMLGYSREEVVGKHASDIVASSELEHIEPALRTIKTEGDYNRLWFFRRKDGSVFPVDVMATKLPDGNLLAMIRDVSDRVASDNRIRELNRTYAVLSDINQLIVREGNTHAIIERACQIAIEKGGFLLAWVGLTNAEGQLELATHAGADDDTLKVVRSILLEPEIGCAFTARALTSGEGALCNDIENDPLSVTWRTAALQRGYHAMASFPLTVNERRVGTFNLYADHVGFFDAEEIRLLEELAGDISFAMTMSERERQRRALEQQLAQNQKLQAIGTLAGGIAHDFNNVISAIAGNAHLARTELSDTHPAITCLEEIDRAAQRAKQLVQRILAFGRPQEHTLRPIKLTPVLEEATRLMRSTLPASIDLRFHGDSSLPTVRADESQIHQIALNLVTNAWHALRDKHGRIDINLAACRVDSTLCARNRDLSPGPYVRLSVTDNGMGMSDATQQRLFEPFFTTKPPGEGTGLGLPVVHGIVRGHGGAIVVDSTPDRGSTFHVFLPACTDLPNEVRQESNERQTNGTQGARILYVDDEESQVFLAKRFLEKVGYRVMGYTEPMEALQVFLAEPNAFDLVITDNNMPHMTGLDLAKQVLQKRPEIPLLLISGYIRPDEVEAAHAIGVRHIVLKPDSVTQFGPLVQRFLAERQTHAPVDR